MTMSTFYIYCLYLFILFYSKVYVFLLLFAYTLYTTIMFFILCLSTQSCIVKTINITIIIFGFILKCTILLGVKTTLTVNISQIRFCTCLRLYLKPCSQFHSSSFCGSWDIVESCRRGSTLGLTGAIAPHFGPQLTLDKIEF